MNQAAKTLICIVCPIGCQVNVVEKGEELIMDGHQCAKGAEYVCKELTNPERMLTTTVPFSENKFQRIAVRTTGPIPKEKILPAMEVVKNIKITSPVKRGQVLISNLINTGVDVIASSDS